LPAHGGGARLVGRVKPRTSLPLLLLIAVFAGGCGNDDDQPEAQRIPGTPDASHAQKVESDPYELTCRDLARQTLHPESAKLVIRAEFALAQVPELRKVVARETLNRTGRSVYFGLTEVCKTKPPRFKPAKLAIAGVLDGKYLAARNRPG
jgi:hypothetical protein